MESPFPDELPRIVEHRYESFPPLQNNGLITQEQYRRVEERLDQMQSDIQTSHRMLRDLSALVHRQLQMTVARNKNRSYSENSPPSSYHILGKGPPLGNLSGLDPLTLVARDTSEVMQTTEANVQPAAVIPPALRVADPRTDSGIAKKKASLPLAVPDPSLCAQWLSQIEANNKPNSSNKKSKAPLRGWAPLPKRVMKVTPLSKGHQPIEAEEEEVTRRFSVSSIDLAKSQSEALSHGVVEQECDVSPEEILSARNLDGEVSRFTLRHDSWYRNCWDLLVIVMIFFDLMFTPLALGFNYSSAFVKVYNVLEPVVFTIDFFVRMFSSYVDEHGNLVSGPKRTAMNYVTSGWAVPDLLSWFPFEVLLGDSSHDDAISFFKIFRLAKVSHLAHRLNSARKAGFVRFVLLLGLVITISHLLTCYWSWVAEDWRLHLDQGVFVPASLFDEYSLCWSLVIGSINASPPIMYSTSELISVACFMLVGNILQASVFGAVAALIASLDESEAAYSKKIITTLERCRFLGIPERLTARIHGYYENLWRETKSISGDADAFIHELSPALICEIKFQLYRDMIRRIPFLSAKTLAPAVIEVLILHLRTVIYMQDDVLIRKGEFGDWMGFIGSKGSVGVLDPNSKEIKIICILRKGDYFGEMALLQHAKRSATTVALTWVQIHVLCRQDLDYVQELYPTQTEILETEITKYKQIQLGIGH